MKLRKLLAIMLITLSIPTFATHNTTKNSTSIGADNLSFVVNANEGQLQQIKSGVYQLTLINVSPYVTYYTRRPNRDSGLATIGNFVKSWSIGTHNFSQDNPNGALIASITDNVTNKSGMFKVFQVAHPNYNANQSTLSFILIPVGSNNQVVIKNENLQGVSLVIN